MKVSGAFYNTKKVNGVKNFFNIKNKFKLNLNGPLLTLFIINNSK